MTPLMRLGGRGLSPSSEGHDAHFVEKGFSPSILHAKFPGQTG